MNVGSLFTGIGGLDLGLERAGMHVRWQCEIDPYCQRVLRKHWPDVRLYEDIRDIDSSTERVDGIAGGFPCQPVSLVGKRKGQEDPRWLWPEFERVLGTLQPRWALIENVPGLASRGLADVLSSLASLGFDAEWDVVSAASVGAPHIRERIFIVAYSRSEGRRENAKSAYGDEGTDARRAKEEDHLPDGDGEGDRAGRLPGDVADANGELPHGNRFFRASRWPELADGSWWETEPQMGRVADGVSGRVAQLRTLGNAVVPQVAEFVGRLIMEAA